MSRRLQVIMPDDEYVAVADIARRRGQSLSRVVRESLRRTVAEEQHMAPEQRIAAVLRFARFTGPTGDIEQLMGEDRARPHARMIYVDSNVRYPQPSSRDCLHLAVMQRIGCSDIWSDDTGFDEVGAIQPPLEG